MQQLVLFKNQEDSRNNAIIATIAFHSLTLLLGMEPIFFGSSTTYADNTKGLKKPKWRI